MLEMPGLWFICEGKAVARAEPSQERGYVLHRAEMEGGLTKTVWMMLSSSYHQPQVMDMEL